jgi:hypothetical protein
MPQTKKVVKEIARQLSNWNLQTQQYGVVITLQGGFEFVIDHQTVIRADVAFVPQNTDRQLTDEQGWTFQGVSFTPIFLV